MLSTELSNKYSVNILNRTEIELNLVTSFVNEIEIFNIHMHNIYHVNNTINISV